MEENVKKWRRDLHQIPELGLEVHQTATYLQEQLETMGYQVTRILDAGLLVYIDLGFKTSIAFRCDMDALEIQEKNEVSYRSKKAGLMHACGHDGHMATMLGFASKLKQEKIHSNHNILLIFQPGEESPGGAKLIMETNIKEKYNLQAIFGMHLMPTYDYGQIACKAGPLMAQNGELDLTIHGQSAHAGLYHEGIDTIVIASQIIQQYQDLISRTISPFEPIVLHIGQIEGGSARNIVAQKTVVKGTIRAFDEKVFLELTRKMEAIHQAYEQSYGCTIEFSCPPMYPPVINDETVYQQFKKCVVGEYIEIKDPFMLAEDFSYYQKEIPGVFFYVGTKTNDKFSGLHTPNFDFDETILLQAIDIYMNIVNNYK